MSSSAWNQVYDRSLHDLLDSEREVRTVLEGEYRKIVALLEKLARQHYGPTLEDQRRAAPEALQKWSAQDWENFFQTAPRTTQNQLGASQAPNSWGKPTKKLSSNGNRLEKQLSRLQEENQQLQAEVLRLQAEISALKPPPEKAAPPKPVARQLLAQNPPRQATLDAFQMPLVPLKYSDLENEFGGLQWRRAQLFLYLMANFGLNAHVELDRYIAPAEGLSYRSNSTKKPVKKLIQTGLVADQTLKLETAPAAGFALWVLRLTDQGRELCQALGWPPVESEWERLRRLAPSAAEYHLAVLYLAVLGRSRGYQVQVLPENAGETQPFDKLRTEADVRLQRTDEQVLVIVETGQTSTTVPDRWRHLHQAQDSVALCALSASQRQQLAKACQQAQLPGKATDLATLKAVKIYETTAADPLWLQGW